MKRFYIVLAAITTIALSGCKDHTVKEQTLPTGAIDFTYEVINDSVYNLDFYAGCTIEDFSNLFNERVREQILSNETLKRFLEISNERLRDSDKKKN